MSRRTLGLVAAVCLVIGVEAEPSRPQQTSQTAQPQQRPVFRTGTNLVQVDAYPRRDDKIVEGLQATDFQVFEDGKPQQIDSLEFIRVETNTPEALRRDPNSQAEGNQLAADPRNRVFVVYLDHYFGSLYGSHNVQRPLVDMLNRMLAPNDLFGVATVFVRPQDLILGRQTRTLEEQLARHWTWGRQTGRPDDLEPDEEYLHVCFGNELPMEVVFRAREERVLDAMDRLISHLGVLREARKVFIVYSKGWPLFRPNQGGADRFLDRSLASVPRVGLSGGKLTTKPPNEPFVADWARCAQEVQRAFMLDNWRKFQDLLTHARQNNVTFYPVNPDGLTGAREDVLRTLASETDGFTSFTNDLGSLLKRIADDMSAYYVLSYYSPSSKADGAYHRIEVKMTRPDVRVQARRGYFSPVASETGSAPAPRALSPGGFDEAVGVLSRLRPTAELFVFGAATASELIAVTELASASGPWANGAEVVVTLTDAKGMNTETRAKIDAGLRGTLVRIPKPAGDGPYLATIRATGGFEALNERLEIRAASGEIVGAPLLFRATPALSSPLRPVADLQFRRTERAHIEWPILTPLDRREARLLSKDGKPLPVPVTLTERGQGAMQVLAADLALAPLAAGDYVIELTAGAGTKTETKFVAIRIRQ